MTHCSFERLHRAWRGEHQSRKYRPLCIAPFSQRTHNMSDTDAQQPVNLVLGVESRILRPRIFEAA